MTVESQLVPISLTRGLDTKTDPKQLVPGKLVALLNGIFQTPKMIRKRFGYSALGQTIFTGGSIGSGVGLKTLDNQLVLLDGYDVYSYSQDTDKWVTAQNKLEPLAITRKSIASSSLTFLGQDSCYEPVNALQCFAWSTGGAVLYSVVDPVTGANVVTPTTLVSGGAYTSIRVEAFNGDFVIFVVDAVANPGILYYWKISSANPTATPSGPVTVASDVSNIAVDNGSFFDCSVFNSKIYIGWVVTGTHSVSLKSLDTSFVLSSTTTVVVDASNGMTLFGDAVFNVWVVYSGAAGTSAFIRVSNLTSSFLPPTLLTANQSSHMTGVIQTASSPARAQIFYSVTSTYASVYSITLDSGGTVGTEVICNVNAGVAGKSFAVGSRTYVLASYQESSLSQALQRTYFLISMQNSNQYHYIPARLVPETGGGLPAQSQGLIASVNALDTNNYQYALLNINQEQLTSSGFLFNYGVVSSTIDFSTTVQSLTLANGLITASGLVYDYDGTQTAELGFQVFPEITNISAGAGGSLSAGAYSYIAVFSWVDLEGQTHRSAPSTPIEITVTATQKATLTIRTLGLTNKNNTISIEIYRTLVNATVYYQVSTPSHQLVNDKTVTTVSFVDGLSDTNLQTQGTLYTDGGEVENFIPPAALAIFEYKNRAVVIPSETPTSWWFSKLVEPGQPLEFSDSFIQNEDATGGGFTAGAQMDDKLVLFKTNTLGYVVGDGPAPNGTGNTYTPWQVVPSQTGCNNKNSLILTPDGLMYQSPKGIFLLDRSLKDHYIGADVEAYNSYTVTSAVHIPTTTQIRFTLSNGTALVYDYDDPVKDERGFGPWSVFSNVSAVDACIYNGVYAYLNTAGLVQKETTAYSDNGTAISLSIQTGWLNFAGVEGYQRTRKMLLVGDYKSAHTLQVQIAYDYDSTVKQTDNIVVASSVVPYEYRINLARQKCEAIQVTIHDSSGTAESMDLSALTFEIGVKKGPYRMAPTRSYG